MPSLRDSAITLDRNKYRALDTRPEQIQNFPAQPTYTQSTVMISSLPSISTSIDGILRQFYGGARVPTRRLILPK